MTQASRKSIRFFRLTLLILSVGYGLVGYSQEEFRDEMVDIGGHKLYTRSAGQGGPTVVFEAGIGGGARNWSGQSHVQQDVALFAATVAYTRAGLHRSVEPGPKPRTSLQIATELHALLQKMGLKPPYVMVGHSAGGLHLRMFAYKYPSEVAGLVLVDPASEDLDDKISASQTKAEQEQTARDLEARLAKEPEGIQDEFAAFKLSKEQARECWPLPRVPVIVVSAGKPDVAGPSAEKFRAMFTELQKEFATRVPNAKQIIATKSGHYIQEQEPELVVQAVKEIVEAYRKSKHQN